MKAKNSQSKVHQNTVLNNQGFVYVVFDLTDAGFHRKFDSIHKTKESASARVEELRKKVFSQLGKNAIFLEEHSLVQ